MKLWDTATWRETATLKGHSDRIIQVAFSSDCKRLVTASMDNTVKLWDVATWQELVTLKEDTPFNAAFSSDGKTLATGGKDLNLWDTATWKKRITIKNDALLAYVAFSPDGRRFAAAYGGGTVKLWDAGTWQERTTVNVNFGEINGMAFSPDSKILAFGNSQNYTVKLCNAATGQEITNFKGQDSVLGIAFSPDGKILVAGSTNGDIKLWDIPTEQRVVTTGPTVLFPDGKMLATRRLDGTLKLWDEATQQELATLKLYPEPGINLAISPDGKILAAATKDKTVKLWDTATKQELATLKWDDKKNHRLLFSPDSKTLVTGSGMPNKFMDPHPTGDDLNNLTLKLWDTATWRERITFKIPYPVTDMGFSSDGKILAAAVGWWTGAVVRGTGMVKLWDVATGQEIDTFVGADNSPILTVAFSPDGKTLAIGCKDRTVRLLDVATKKELAVLKGHKSVVK